MTVTKTRKPAKATAKTGTAAAKETVEPKGTKKMCWCGCGGETNTRFVPGHDARYHGLAKKVARKKNDLDTEIEKLPHEEARIEFLRHVEAERPIFAAKEAAKAKEEKGKKKAK